MKNLKNILSVILAVIIMLTATSTMAYSGTLDARDDISISDTMTKGRGVIDIARGVAGYKLYYQANELSNDTYKQIKQLKDELRVIQAFNVYELTKSDADYNEYYSAQMYYKNLYGKIVEDWTDEKIKEDASIIKNLLPNYTDSWKQTTDNSFDIELSNFSGNKDFVVWVQLTGTKKDTTNKNGNSGSNNNGSSNNGNNGSNNNGSSNSGNNGSNNNGSSNNGNNGSNNNGSSNNGNNGSNNSGNSGTNNNGSSNNGTSTDVKNAGKDTSTKSISSTGDKTTSSSKLPYAGMAKGTTIIAILIAIAGAVISYIKYRKLN